MRGGGWDVGASMPFLPMEVWKIKLLKNKMRNACE